MKITWLGHSAFRIEHGDNVILIDPFLTGNPSFEGTVEKASAGATHILLTHGHDDHIGDSVEILKNTGAMLVANFEICMHLTGKGVSDQKINPGNHGGTVDCGGFTTSFVHALHSSSTQTGDGGNVYLGNPAGLVLHFPDAPTVYHMGDTDIFSDMALINELHQPEIGIVPIGDRFTMGGALAALACRRFFKFETIIPCHYASFPIVDQSADAFLAAMESEASRVKVMSPGDTLAP
jgi:L-ascorbate metabolism protein UlaG (beta-lactamase superfamily)